MAGWGGGNGGGRKRGRPRKYGDGAGAGTSVPQGTPRVVGDASGTGPGPDPDLDGGEQFVDPASLGENDGGGSGPLGNGDAASGGRGRSRGSAAGSGKTKGKATVNVPFVEMMLLNIHNMAAGFTKIEELQLSEAEANSLAKSVANVARHYEALPGMSEKAADWIALGVAMGSIYGPRVIAYQLRASVEKQPKKTGFPNVVPQ